MKQMTRDELVEGMYKAWGVAPMGMSARDTLSSVLAYLESVGTVVRQADILVHMYSERTELYPELPCHLLLPYDPRPKQASAKKRAAEKLRQFATGKAFAYSEAELDALADELEAE